MGKKWDRDCVKAFRIVRVQRSGVQFEKVLIPVVDRLGTDRLCDKTEARIGRRIARRLKEPKYDE
jgi:hypothetical protein